MYDRCPHHDLKSVLRDFTAKKAGKMSSKVNEWFYELLEDIYDRFPVDINWMMPCKSLVIPTAKKTDRAGWRNVLAIPVPNFF